jgi:hypothetical protein
MLVVLASAIKREWKRFIVGFENKWQNYTRSLCNQVAHQNGWTQNENACRQRGPLFLACFPKAVKQTAV